MTIHAAPISVVIPAYNAESFIGEAIRSVHAQTVKVAEIIVVADDCRDRTAQIAAELGAVVLEQKKRNISAARNLGVIEGTQPWIALLDADDFWQEEKIAWQWKAITTCPAAAFISCDFRTVNEAGVWTPSRRHVRERWKNLEATVIADCCCYVQKVSAEFLARSFLAVPTVMLRRDVFSTVGFFDESLIYGQAIEFFARVLARYPLAFVERPLVYQRVHRANHTRNVHGSWASYVSIIDRMLRCPDMYPKGAGKAYREHLKRDFHQAERALARRRPELEH